MQTGGIEKGAEWRQLKQCPLCAESIKLQALKCKHCHADLTDSGLRSAQQPDRNGGLPAVLSVFVVGLGQIYNGRIGIGLAAMIVCGISLLSIIAWRPFTQPLEIDPKINPLLPYLFLSLYLSFLLSAAAVYLTGIWDAFKNPLGRKRPFTVAVGISYMILVGSIAACVLGSWIQNRANQEAASQPVETSKAQSTDYPAPVANTQRTMSTEAEMEAIANSTPTESEMAAYASAQTPHDVAVGPPPTIAETEQGGGGDGGASDAPTPHAMPHSSPSPMPTLAPLPIALAGIGSAPSPTPMAKPSGFADLPSVAPSPIALSHGAGGASGFAPMPKLDGTAGSGAGAPMPMALGGGGGGESGAPAPVRASHGGGGGPTLVVAPVVPRGDDDSGGARESNPAPNNNRGRSTDAQANLDFGLYMADLQRRIKKHWFPPKGKQYKRVVVVFKVHTGGELSDLRIDHSSGVQLADNAALKAVEDAAPFRPLPYGWPSDVDSQFVFEQRSAGGDSNVSGRLLNVPSGDTPSLDSSADSVPGRKVRKDGSVKSAMRRIISRLSVPSDSFTYDGYVPPSVAPPIPLYQPQYPPVWAPPVSPERPSPDYSLPGWNGTPAQSMQLYGHF